MSAPLSNSSFDAYKQALLQSGYVPPTLSCGTAPATYQFRTLARTASQMGIRRF